MADLTPRERLQPALLDRLTDDRPDRAKDAREMRVMTKAQLRQAVLRDLGWLFNATNLESGESLARYPHVRRSVVNFGLPALSGRTASTVGVSELERGIREAILAFEPRLLPDSLVVRAIITESQLDRHNVVAVEIEGQLWAQPVPLEMLVRTEIDLETGRVEIADMGRSR
jgi:type VI secretion system protein ImpF